jgi:hypothetical protein
MIFVSSSASSRVAFIEPESVALRGHAGLQRGIGRVRTLRLKVRFAAPGDRNSDFVEAMTSTNCAGCGKVSSKTGNVGKQGSLHQHGSMIRDEARATGCP